MERKYWRGREVESQPELPDDPLGPDERDIDLLDDSWEVISAPRRRRRSSPILRAVLVALSIFALLGLIVPMVAAATR
ncbi:MAG TPA: hypothetical protein QGF35_03975 [Dehalococcoidia bacterium]|nr:hypothetical protein [Dehalococcoidia bacterium]